MINMKLLNFGSQGSLVFINMDHEHVFLEIFFKDDLISISLTLEIDTQLLEF